MPFPYDFPLDFGDDGGGAPPRVLSQLLPRGAVWLLEAQSWITQTLLALSDELNRVQVRGLDLLAETDPQTATETLPDWERVLGLPDSAITSIPVTTAARRQAITQQLVRQGGQNAAFFVSLAGFCGYTVTVVDNYGATILRSGFRSGSRCYGAAWAYVWRLDVQPPTGSALTHAELEAIIKRAAPAHTVVLFNYL